MRDKQKISQAQERYREKNREDLAEKARSYRKHQRNKMENRLGYLESEVARLQKSLEVAQRGSAMP